MCLKKPNILSREVSEIGLNNINQIWEKTLFLSIHSLTSPKPWTTNTSLSSEELCLWNIVTLMLKHVFFFLFILSTAAAICIWKSLWCLYLQHTPLWSLWLVQYEYTMLSRSDLKRRNEAKLVFPSEPDLKGAFITASSLLILFSQVWINPTFRRLTNRLTAPSSGLFFFASEPNQILFIKIF